MGKLKGQDSTEYLVVLAGVLLVSFLILVLLGRSPSSSSSVTDQQLQAYWTGTTPFAISTAKVTNESISLAVSNTLTEQVYLTAIEAQDDSGNNGTILIPNKSFNAGEKIVLSNDSFTTLNPCTGKAAGSAYKLKSITFIYSQGAISGIRQQGTQPLMGACSGYVQSGESLTPTSTPIPESTSTPTPAPEFDCGTSVSFTYNGGAVTYGTVTSQAGKCWLDRNLGATQVANASDDSAAYGGLFQWGRLDDGHQARDSETTLNLSSTDNPGHSSFIDGEDFTWDWRSPQNDNLWQGTSGINNPCPSGWRVPTITEWQAEIDAGSWAGFESAYDSPLKLTRAGYRYGFVDSEGSYAWYWSSTVDGTNAEYLYFYDGDAGAYSDSRSNGGSVRCVSDTFSCGNNVTFTYRGGQVTYGTVESQAGKCFMDRNLGASQVANASDDSAAYGDLFEWGRLDDGHQARDSETTNSLSFADNPGHSSFISAANFSYDWRYPQNDNLWQGTSQINNPCPSGWRVPTIDEWQAEIDAGSWSGPESAYASPLKLTRAGYRYYESPESEGSYGEYWSSTVNGEYADCLYDGDYQINPGSDDRDAGFSVRCVSDAASVISLAAIPGVTPPVTLATPVTTITTTGQYTGTVTWSPEAELFAGETVYTATINLTPKTGYTLTGVAGNSFTVAEAANVTNPADSGVITAVFPATAYLVINLSAIPGVTAPALGATPVTAVTETVQYTGTVTWSPEAELFAGETVYTATINLTPKTGYTLTGVAGNSFTVAEAANVTNPADSGVITAVFPSLCNESSSQVRCTETTNGPYIIKKFIYLSDAGTSNWTAPSGVNSVQYLVVGGGGGGGATYYGGGGGGGGMLEGTLEVTPGTSYNVTVGAGGSGGCGDDALSYNGSDSKFGDIAGNGGGAGGTCGLAASPGGSGGGGGCGTGGSGIAGQGYAGGIGADNLAAGGGGAGGPGYCGAACEDNENRSDGGIGRLSNITGIPTYYAGGGGGNTGSTSKGLGGLGGGGNGIVDQTRDSTAGTNGTGGGGGGACHGTCCGNTDPWVCGKEGGSGVVIIRYVTQYGVCGSANGSSFESKPTTGLCSGGNASAVSGSGPWTWNCTGVLSNASCSADKVIIVSFTDVGTTDWTVPDGVNSVEYLVVAGGGGGGYYLGGGGGGGGVLTSNLSVAGSVSVTVGDGGTSNTNGENSSFSSIVAVGGGAGGANSDDGSSGGSGGGGGADGDTQRYGGSGTAGQGYSGGNGEVTGGGSEQAGGGGGGAGGIGTAGGYASGGDGGIGVLSSINGTTVYYAGGGAGMVGIGGEHIGVGGAGGGANGIMSYTGGLNGTNGLGGGGGGGYQNPGGKGGFGIVIIRYVANTQYGVCGSANGSYFESKPIVGLCSSGTASSVSGSGPWTWNCTGTLSNASCSADKVTIVSFTDVGSINWTVPDGVASVDYLVVGGGGGGGGWFYGGGGGAGGFVNGTGFAVTPGSTLNVTVGAGGAGAVQYDSGSLGGNSTFGSIVAFGGGAGADGGQDGINGGSGGGGSCCGYGPGAGMSGQGNAGGAGHDPEGGGGGGAGAAGNAWSASPSSKGGDGLLSSISGTPTYYAGGGGGGGNGATSTASLGGGGIGSTSGQPPGSGTANTGGGGGGLPHGEGGNYEGYDTAGSGGSGIIIIRYVSN